MYQSTTFASLFAEASRDRQSRHRHSHLAASAIFLHRSLKLPAFTKASADKPKKISQQSTTDLLAEKFCHTLNEVWPSYFLPVSVLEL